MAKTVAVVAHFDPKNRLDPSFRIVLSSLQEFCDEIILVTTCTLPSSEIPEEPNIITIQRPNIGYDFYSYRVGIDEVLRRRGGCKRIFILNSSFLVINQKKFLLTLKEMLDSLDGACIVGITKSNQFTPHLQTYLFLMEGNILVSQWFRQWLSSLVPHNNKWETILQGELGFSKTLAQNNIQPVFVFQIKTDEYWKASIAWIKSLIKSKGWSGFWTARDLLKIRELNPVHFAAPQLAKRCGIVKTELLRNNPHSLDVTWLDTVSASNEHTIIRQFIERSPVDYQMDGTGFTIYKRENTFLPENYLIYSGPVARPGVEVAVVLHIYYPELIPEICVLLRNIIEPMDLYITTPHESSIQDIFNSFSKFAHGIVVGLCENRGRDIGPFMTIFRQGLLNPYKAVLKLHTKRSLYSEEGNYWRQKMYFELCGNVAAVLHTIELLRNDCAGIVGPHDYYLTNSHFWGADMEKTKSILTDVGMDFGLEVPPLGFFAGSMFWFNPKALAPLHDIPETSLAFESETGQQDGTLAHAMERVFCTIARKSGYKTTSLLLDGQEIHETDTENNTVPVL